MLIVADENIPLLDAFFEGFGEIRRVPGRAIDRAAIEQADVLLVRSVTNVNRALLEGTPVRFVGTCTIGTDHLDLDYFSGPVSNGPARRVATPGGWWIMCWGAC
jgi:erythronate-4-phosphate dehydrogenase